MLRGSGGEAVSGLDDAVQKLLGCAGTAGLGEEGLGGGDHVGFAPLFVGGVHGFGDAVGKGYEDVSGLEADGGAGVRDVGEQADDGSGGFEGDGLVPRRMRGGLWPALT